MTRPTMRRLLCLLGTLGALALLSPPAGAQEAPDVRLTLLSQAPWSSSYDPAHDRELLLSFRAENLGSAPLGELSIGVTLYGRILSRTQYESSLTTDPSLVIDAETFPREDPLEPGRPRDFTLAFPLDSPSIDPDDSGVYPLKVDLRSGLTSLAAIRSAVVFLVRPPEVPVDLSWTLVLHEPLELEPDGVFTSTDLETALAPGGRLAAQIDALLELAEDPTAPPVDVAVSPLLLTQLSRMRDGYQVRSGSVVHNVTQGEAGALLAQEAIDDLRTIAHAPNVRISALPFASPELPSLVSGGLPKDAAEQVDRGREVIGALLETTPVAGILRPPGAALDEPTLQQLPAMGVTTIVAGPATVSPSPQPLGFVGPPTARLGRNGDVTAIVPEPGIMALLQSPTAATDPILTTQVVLGELAIIWQEQPGVERGVALALSEDLQLPPAFYRDLLHDVARAPWLAPMHAGDFALRYHPEEISALTAPAPRRFASTYVQELRRARRRVAVYRSMLTAPSERPDELDTLLLLAESRQFLSDPTEGLAFIQSVSDDVGAVFDAISVDSPPQITLTSSTGSGIPVSVSNGDDEGLRFTIQLVSQNLRGAPSTDLELGPGESQTVRFRVEAQRTGRFVVVLRVLAPTGRIIDEQTLIVRSTVYNRIALVITIAAALVLLGLWARRLLPRRTS
jgi:hypothetical protein